MLTISEKNKSGVQDRGQFNDSPRLLAVPISLCLLIYLLSLILVIALEIEGETLEGNNDVAVAEVYLKRS